MSQATAQSQTQTLKTQSNGDPYMSDPTVEVEPTARWVRVKFGRYTIADSRRVLLLRERGRLPVYYFPQGDVRLELLQPSSDGGPAGSEPAAYYHIQAGDRTAENAAWSFPDPSPRYAPLKDYFSFKWGQMDAWFEEEEEIFVHPRDPYHRVDAMPSTRHIRVVIDGVTVADTKRPTLLFETGLPARYYLPAEDVRTDLLQPTSAHTRCPYKGLASYWTYEHEGHTARNIVWSYPEPIPECPKIKGLLCFYNEKVDTYVDGELEPRPQSPWS